MSTGLLSNIRSSLSHFRGVLLLSALLSSGVAEAAAPPAGTIIQNTANATYEIPSADPLAPVKTGMVTSNTVEATDNSFTPPSLSKSASVASSMTGGLISYTLNLFTGDVLTPRTVTVDGSDRQLIVVRDAIPANTSFAAIQQAAGALVMYQILGTNADQYQTTAPSDLSTVAAIAYGFQTLAPNSQVSMQFQVLVSQFPGGNISNTGVIDASINGKPGTVPSNPVVVNVPPKNGTLEYRKPDLVTPDTVTTAPTPLNLYADAGVCNTDPAVAEKYFVRLTTKLSQDIEDGSQTRNTKFQMTETGPNTGVFTATGIPTKQVPPAPSNNNGVVEVTLNDTVNATLVCGTATMNASILINPAGVVYDSSTGKPVEGAQVLLVKNGDSSKALLTVTTKADGVFQFPVDDPGSYSFMVLPPKGYVFPSTSPKRYDYRHLGDGSFGQPFASTSAASMAQDIPLDPVPTGLTLEKMASQDTVQIGETVTYTLTLRNGTINPLDGVVLDDVLPLGFTLVSKTARINGVAIANPAGAPGRKLSFPIGNLDVGQSVTLTYVALLGTGASAGDGINVAQAHDLTSKVLSNIARAKVTIDKGVFSDEAMIFGKIFVDCNRDDLQGREELGIPGVRMYLDDGTYAVSDEEGKYSFYGISPRTHVLKLDRTTLPAGSEMATVSNRNAGDPQSRFVDLKNGEMHRADFAEGSCTPEILALVKARRKAGEVLSAKLNTTELQDDPLLQPLRVDGVIALDARARPATGVIGADGKIIADASLLGITSNRNEGSALGAAPLAVTPSVNLEAVLPKLENNKFGFVDLKDDDTLPSTDLSVRVMGRDGSNFRLFVNGAEIPASRVGQRARMPSRDVQVWEYIGVKMMPGVNTLRAENYDDFGTLREKTSITLTAPGKPGKLVMVLPPDGAVADGVTPARIMVRLLDADNVPVTARTLVTLESSVGRWNVEDLDEKEPGVQTFIQGGEALFDLIPTSEPGNANLRVSSGILETSERLPLTAYLRPLIASGIIEGAVGFNKLNPKAMSPVSPADGFEQDIKNLNSDGSSSQAGIRGSMFLKGKVKGKYLLTLAYDSDKDTQQRLFRDIDPENYYPIYGDSSIKGFDAQSTSKLYVRIDKGRSYLLYGDFNTNDQTSVSQARQLSNYSRSLTGVREHFETDKVTINLFASHQTNQKQTTEFRAQGISGPYKLLGGKFLVNSEKIEIVTRNRNQPGALVGLPVQLNRFIDYTIDELKGSIIFTQPIAGVDSELNPVFIRVTWEVENGGDAYWVYGADGTYRLNKRLEVGASVVRDNTPAASTTMYGANAVFAFTKDSALTVEAARSNDEETGTAGNAWRAEWNHSGAGVEGRVYASKSDDTFNNPNGGLSAGTREAGVKGGWQLNESFRLNVEGLTTESSTSGTGSRAGIFSSIQYALTENVKTSLGVRFTHQEESAAVTTASPSAPPVPDTGIAAIPGSDTTSVNGKISWTPKFVSKTSLFTEYEQSVTDASARMLGVGGTYQIADRSRLYARHQLISSTTGPFGLSDLNENQNSTAIGIDYDYMKNGNAFSEYRVRDAIDGPQAQAAVGLRNGWNWKAVRLTTQFERVEPLDSSTVSQENTAVSVGLQYTGDPLLKAGTRLEWRQSETQTSVLNTIALARKLSLDWSVLGKNTISWTDQGNSTIVDTTGLSIGGATIRDRLRVGAAWRQTDSNEWAWLGLFETRYDRDPTIDQTRVANIVSSNINYQPHRQWVFNGRYAMKYVNETNSGIKSHFIGNLLSGRAMFDITEKWDAGVISSVVLDRHSLQYGVGAEVGYVITSNLWLSGGYNFAGYQDKDFDDSNYTRKGPYVRLRFKFDEEMFRWLE